MDKNERLPHIDIAKGILIILVVVGHVLTGSHFVTKVMIRVINSFHMPAFFIITGMLTNTSKLRAQPFGTFLKKKAVRLLVPYVVFELVGMVWQMIMLGNTHPDIVAAVRNILTVHCYVGADWFLIAMFFAEMILYWINKYAFEKWHVYTAAVSFLAAFYLPDEVWLLANCRRIFASLSFILIGIQCRAFFQMDSARLFALCTTGLIAGAALNSGTPSIALRLFEKPLLFIMCGICGAYVVLFVSRIISKSGSLRGIVEQVGRASLVIMGTHQNVVLIFSVLYGVWTSLLTKTIILASIVFVEIPLVLLCRRFVPAWVGETKKRQVCGKIFDVKR